MSTPTPPPVNQEEGVFAHLMRSTKNALTKCMGCAQSADEKAKIKYKEYQIETRKKAFGQEYLNLFKSNAEEAALKKCLDTAMADVGKFESEIEELQKEIERVDTETQKKLLNKPGDDGAAAAAETAGSPPTTAATSSAAAPTSATATASSTAPAASTTAPTTSATAPAATTTTTTASAPAPAATTTSATASAPSTTASATTSTPTDAPSK